MKIQMGKELTRGILAFDVIAACPVIGCLNLSELDMGEELDSVSVQIAHSNETRKFIMVKRVDENGGNGSYWKRVE